jgi:hypothetical protein
MRDRQTGLRTAAWLAAFVTGVLTATALPSVAFADKPADKTAKADKAAPKAAKAKPPAKKKGAKAEKAEADKAEEAKRAEARKNYEDGETKFANNDYAGAFTGYKAANDIIPSPQTLYKMAVSLDKQGKADDAVVAYQTFLDSKPPTDKYETKIADSQARLAEIKKKTPIVFRVKTDPAGASIAIDGDPQMGTTPLELKLPPGKHTLHVTSPGYEAADKELNVAAGSESVEVTLNKAPPKEVAVKPPPAPTPAPAAPAPPPAGERKAGATGYVLVGLAAVGVGVGTVFGIKALNAKSDFNNGNKTNDQADTVDRNALVADLIFGTALTLGVTGTVLLLSGSDKSTGGAHETFVASRPSLRLVPVVGPTTAAASAVLQF